jgi:hypothetical protein
MDEPRGWVLGDSSMSGLPDLTIRTGETLPITFQTDDTSDTGTAVLTVKQAVDSPTAAISKSAPIVGGVADLTLSAADTTITPGDYLYQITATYDDGTVEKYPDQEGCDGDECGFPQLTVCEALDLGVS